MAPVKVGIVGLGWVSTAHAPAFLENSDCELVAVCSRRDWDKQELASIYGEKAKLYNNYEEFLNHPGLEVVDITTEHPLHAEQAIKAAEAGKHVMIEKPASLDFESLVKMKETFDKTGVQAAVFFELRYIPHSKLIRSILHQGLIGDIHHLEVDYYHGIGPWYGQYPWNVKKDKGGSSLLTAGIHALDSLLYFKQADVEEVFAYSTKTRADVLKEYEYDTTEVALLRFSDGTLGKCASCIDARQPYLFNIHILGSEGAIWNDRMWSAKMEGLNADGWVDMPTAKAESGDVLAHPYGPQMNDFIECVRSGKQSIANFNDGFKTHQVVFAIEKSLQEKRAVKLSEL
jgi:predicted dehydrogenase